MDELRFLAQPLGPNVAPAPRERETGVKGGASFAEVLARTPATRLKLSAHASQRLSSRQIRLEAEDWAKLEAGVDKVAAKGGREALLVSDKAALVVSVKNRTVITVVDPAQLKENVFTNIDSAVLV
jgi:flagellar operon protein